MAARSARQRRAADSVSVSSTACRSKVERPMTLSMSAVAVCCCRDSVSSRVRACTSSNSLTFSIAIAAWSAKVLTSSICLAVDDDGADQLIFLEHWHRQTRPSPGSVHCRDAQRIAIEIGLFGFQVGNVDCTLGTRETAEACRWTSGEWATV